MPLEPLWRFQREAERFAGAHAGSLLALPMGRGKTRVVVDLVQSCGWQRVLVLCPLAVAPAWKSQFESWATKTIDVTVLDGGSVEKKMMEASRRLVQAGPQVIVINYESAWREPFRSLTLRTDWDCVVADESHKLKDPGGVTSRFAQTLAKRARYRIGLTGTPMPHSPLDIYAQYRFLDSSVFGTSFVRFRSRFAIMGGYQNHEVIGYQNQEELQAGIRSIGYFLRPGDDLELPPVRHLYETCELSPRARSIYESLKRDLIVEIETGSVTAANALVALLRLQQITSGYARTEDGYDEDIDDNKAQLLKELLDDLEPTEPVVIFCRFIHDLDVVRQVSNSLGRASLELSGREKNLAAWQAGEAPILAVQIQAGGLGIDLTRAAYAIYYSLGFSLGDYEQSVARLHRPGQNRRVTCYHLLAKNTVDQTVYGALRARKQVIETVLEKLCVL